MGIVQYKPVASTRRRCQGEDHVSDMLSVTAFFRMTYRVHFLGLRGPILDRLVQGSISASVVPIRSNRFLSAETTFWEEQKKVGREFERSRDEEWLLEGSLALPMGLPSR